MNAVPDTIYEMEVAQYKDFLAQRRRLMALNMRDYYFSL